MVYGISYWSMVYHIGPWYITLVYGISYWSMVYYIGLWYIILVHENKTVTKYYHTKFQFSKEKVIKSMANIKHTCNLDNINYSKYTYTQIVLS